MRRCKNKFEPSDFLTNPSSKPLNPNNRKISDLKESILTLDKNGFGKVDYEKYYKKQHQLVIIISFNSIQKTSASKINTKKMQINENLKPISTQIGPNSYRRLPMFK